MVSVILSVFLAISVLAVGVLWLKYFYSENVNLCNQLEAEQKTTENLENKLAELKKAYSLIVDSADSYRKGIGEE